MRVRLHNGYMQAYVQKMKYTHMLKVVTGRVETKLLSRRRQSDYRVLLRVLYSYCMHSTPVTVASIYPLSTTN